MELPIFPLGNVLFPGGVLALNIFEPRYVAMTRRCLERNTGFGVFLIQGGYEVGAPAVPQRVGCLARITEWSQPTPTTYRLQARGGERLRLLSRRVQDDGLIIGEVEGVEPPEPTPLPERFRAMAEQLRELDERLVPGYALPKPMRLDACNWVAYRWAELLRVNPETRQRWLEIDEPLTAIDAVARVHRDVSR